MSTNHDQTPTQRAFSDGIDAHVDGRPLLACPFSAQSQRELFDAWVRGWINERDLRAALQIKGGQTK